MFETMRMALGALLDVAARGGPYLIDGRVARSGVTAVSAETGVGKSVFCLGAAMGLAAGHSRIYGREVWSPRERNVLGGDGGEQRGDERPEMAFVEGRVKLRERLRDEEASFDVVFLDNLHALQNVQDVNSPAQAQRAIRDAEKMGDRFGGVPVVLAVHPSKNGGPVNAALLRRGAMPEPAQAISGAMTTAQRCGAIICLARDTGEGKLLLGTAKMRAARRDDQVYQTTPELVDLELPAWTDEDGVEHPPRTQSGVPVLGDQWEARGKTSSAASELVDWMAEIGLEGRPNAMRLKEVATLEDCPAAEGTLRNYGKGESAAAREAAALGFRADLGERPAGRKGRAPLMIWVATAEEMASEDGAGEEGSE